MANGRKYEKKNSEKMLEQLISFNFLKSKVSHLAAIYQQKKTTYLQWVKKIKKIANFIEFVIWYILFLETM